MVDILDMNCELADLISLCEIVVASVGSLRTVSMKASRAAVAYNDPWL